MSRAVLLVNLGTPRSPSVRDVRAYLNEFLMDPHVLNLPWLLRRLVVSAFILPFRPRRSAAAYASIWDDGGQPNGSPLLRHTEALGEALRERCDLPCAVAMRYGEPNIADAVHGLAAKGCEEVMLVPLFPKHADATRTTAIKAVRGHLPAHIRLRVLPPFYDREDYVECQADLIERHLPSEWDHLLLSYHGLPEKHITQADPTGSHCLANPDCCEYPSEAHATCYRHQCYATATALTARLGLDAERVTVSFQSRLGHLPWLKPYTDRVLADLPGLGVRRLAVYCPSFVADNLETLEEIGIQGRETFQEAGGESLTLIPCLNASPDWVNALARWVG